MARGCVEGSRAGASGVLELKDPSETLAYHVLTRQASHKVGVTAPPQVDATGLRGRPVLADSQAAGSLHLLCLPESRDLNPAGPAPCSQPFALGAQSPTSLRWRAWVLSGAPGAQTQ